MRQALVAAVRGVSSFGVIVLAAAGCSLIYTFEPDELPEAARNKYHCSAEVIDDLGLRRVVYNYDDAGHDLVLSQCFVLWEELGLDSLEDVEDAWHRWLDDEIEDDGWCVVADTISCRDAGPLGEETCPAVDLSEEARDFCAAEGTCCIRSAPPVLDFEELQQGAGMERWTPVGIASPLEPTATLRNDCDRPVSFRPRQGLLGDHPGDFELVDNSCVVPDPPEAHPDGLTLGPAGAADDFCSYQLRFLPNDQGLRSARMEFVQSDSPACTISDMPRFSGRGQAGSLSGIPDEICFGGPSLGACTTPFDWQLTNDGPGVVTIEGIEVTGNFELLSANPGVLAPGSAERISVRWCSGIGPEGDEGGTLTIVSNASVPEITVPLSRRTAECP